jgi:tetratricopeptide (TPR) repeat protein
MGSFRLMIDESVGGPMGAAGVDGDDHADRTVLLPPGPVGSGGRDLNYPQMGGSAGTGTKPAAGPWDWFTANRNMWLSGGGGLLAAASVGLFLYSRPPDPPPDERGAHITEARALIAQGEAQRAIIELEAVLEVDPDDADALELKKQAAGLSQQGPPPPPPPPSGGGGLLPANEVQPEGGPQQGRPASQTPAKPSGGTTTVAQPPSATPQQRAQLVLSDARRLLEAGTYADAEQKANEALGLANSPVGRDLLAEIQRRRKLAGAEALKQGADSEAAFKWEEAIDRYTRAHELDPTIAIDARVKAVADKKAAALATLADTLTRADSMYKIRRDAEALRLYREAEKLLPQGHPRTAEVARRIEELKK